jgi:hypothetical protein
MAKRLKSAKTSQFELLIVDNGSPHGYLNMHSLAGETHDAFAESLDVIKQIIEDFDRGGSGHRKTSTSSNSSNKY